MHVFSKAARFSWQFLINFLEVLNLFANTLEHHEQVHWNPTADAVWEPIYLTAEKISMNLLGMYENMTMIKKTWKLNAKLAWFGRRMLYRPDNLT